MLRLFNRIASSNLWFGIKYTFWPGFRQRYEQALQRALERRRVRVRARLDAKLADHEKFRMESREKIAKAIERGVQMIRDAEAHGDRMADEARREAAERAKKRFEELQPLLIRERRLELLSQAEQELKRRLGRDADKV